MKRNKAVISKEAKELLAKKIDAITYRQPTKQSDLYFKDEGDITTLCFVSDKAQEILKSDPAYAEIKERIYGIDMPKIDILNESVRGMIAWAVSHGLTIDNG